MLFDAVAAEGFKLWRNRSALFWGFLFVPLLALVIGAAVELWFQNAVVRSGVVPSLNLARATLKAVGDAGSPFTQLFLLIAGASVFGGEYRWESWRLLTPRNSRANLLLGKALVVALAAGASVLLVALAGLGANAVGSAARQAPVVWDAAPGFGGRVAGLFLLTWAQVLQPLAVGALAAVATRSILAAVMVPIVLGIAQALLMGQAMQGGDTPAAWAFVVLPGLCVEVLKAWIEGRLPQSELVAPAIAGLAGWVVVPVAAAVALFQRQDLSKE